MKIACISLGCPKNQVDLDVMVHILLSAGHETVADLAEADVFADSSCGFIESAKTEAIENILEACSYKQANPNLKVVVTGCLAERYRSQIEEEIPEVDAVVGCASNKAIDSIVARLFNGEEHLESYGLKPPVYSISNGVDTEFFAPDPTRRASFRRRWGLREGERAVISVGHTIARKGLPEFLELARRMPEARFLWFGWTDPHLIPQEIRQAMEQAPENVTFAGFVDRETLREAYCGADVFAFMSHEETEGIVVLEALACGIPTVVRDIPVYNGWLREGQNVYKASGTDEFQQKAEGLLTGTLPDLTAAGRRVAEERSLSVMGERLREVYRRMDILPAAQPAAKTNLPQAERPVQHSFTP